MLQKTQTYLLDIKLQLWEIVIGFNLLFRVNYCKNNKLDWWGYIYLI